LRPRLHNSIARRRGGQGDCGLWISGLGKKKNKKKKKKQKKKKKLLRGIKRIRGLHGLRNRQKQILFAF